MRLFKSQTSADNKVLPEIVLSKGISLESVEKEYNKTMIKTKTLDDYGTQKTHAGEQINSKSFLPQIS